MLTWFRNRWPDPRIKEREEELRLMVERHEAGNKAWSRKLDGTVNDYLVLLKDFDELKAKHRAAEGRALKAESELFTRPVKEVVKEVLEEIKEETK